MMCDFRISIQFVGILDIDIHCVFGRDHFSPNGPRIYYVFRFVSNKLDNLMRKKPIVRKRRSDVLVCHVKRSHSCTGGADRSTKSLNDISISSPNDAFGGDLIVESRNYRRRSLHSAEEEIGTTDFILPARPRSKRAVDFEGALDQSETDVSRTTTSGKRIAYRRSAGKTSHSTTNVVQEYVGPYPLLRSQMSDPGDCDGISRRGGKRDSSGKSLMDFTGNEPQSVSYSAFGGFKGNFDPLTSSWPTLTMNGYSPAANNQASLEDSWKSVYTRMVTSQGMGLTPASVRNPNKAILTLEHPSTRILIANDAAHRLFAVGHDQLVGHRLSDMVVRSSTLLNKTDGPQAENADTIGDPSVMDRFASVNSGQNEDLTSGKVIEIVDALEAVSPVALWLLPLTQHPQLEANLNRCLAILEPVERINASCTLGPKGRIFACDDRVADMFGYHSSSEVLGFNVTELVPALVLPPSKHCTDQYRQNLTGRFRNGASFPVTVKLLPEFDGDKVVKYNVTFYIYTTISGLITVLPNGIIHSFNNHFVSTMFGLRPESLNGKSINAIIPKFYAETGAAESESSNNAFYDENSIGPAVSLRFPELTINDSCYWSKRRKSGSSTSLLMLLSGNSPSPSTSATMANAEPFSTVVPFVGAAASSSTPPATRFSSQIAGDGDVNDNSVLDDDMHSIPEGSFWGFGLHRDGSLFGVGYQIRRLVLKDGSVLYCIWVVRDPEALICHNLTRFGACGAHGLSRSESQMNTSLDYFDAPKALPANKMTVDLESEEKEYIRGEYAKHYDTLQQIGKGAFGCVKMAARKSDGLLVVTKFIPKNRIQKETECWADHKQLGRIPLEIDLLLKLKHENIVRVMAVYQNESYFQMVMEKHGSGMDLFEFIDRHPLMDEKLASYLFRQVAAAVSYLHSLNIVHRDIKDENVIIDEHFHCKLIDFGSAAYFKEGKLFSTICGTIEYCSPEVLTGNKYAGQELEMWSMGVLLYTLLFFENPFDNVEETIQANLDPPWDISEGLFHLLSWLLHPIPQDRATISDVERHWWVTQPVDIKQYRFEDIIIIQDYRELNPPKYLSDLQPAVSTQASPARAQTTKADSVHITN